MDKQATSPLGTDRIQAEHDPLQEARERLRLRFGSRVERPAVQETKRRILVLIASRYRPEVCDGGAA